MPFPNTPAPAHYRQCSFPNNRAGAFYLGDTVTITLASSAVAGVTYEVRDYYGTVLSTGSVSGTTVTPTPPVGGWKLGWYRMFMYYPALNLMADGDESFEIGTGGWSAVGQPPPDQSAVRARSGTKSLHTTLSGGTELRRTVSGLTNGQQYTFSAYGYSATSNADFRVVAISNVTGSTVTTKNAFTRATVTFTASGTTQELSMQGVTATGELWWDDIQLETGASATTFVPDVLFGLSAGATNFIVIRNDSRFPAFPNPATHGNGGLGGEGRNIVDKAILGMATSRLLITDANNPTLPSNDDLSDVQADVVLSKDFWTNPVHTAFLDPVRQRKLWVNFPGQAYDRKSVLNASSQAILHIYPKDETIDTSQVFLALANGTSSGFKLTVAFPNSGTIVETYDNVASQSVLATALLASAYVRGFTTSSSGTMQLFSSVAIGNAYKTGVASVVTALWPDVKYYEGPENEPSLSAEVAHRMRLFQAAVKSGNAGAYAIGPCPVSINTVADTKWKDFMDAGGGTYCDSFAVHDYNATTNGNLAQGRQHIQRWFDFLAKYGMEDKEVWQTEAGAAFTPVYGIHHPRRARVSVLHTLLWEQFGVPHERNIYWYDRSHGFWSFPTWWQAQDKSVTPEGPVYRVLAEEVFGKVHDEALSYGPVGDDIFLGSIYRSPTDDSAVLVHMASSCMDDATITYRIDGWASGALTSYDCWGNSTSVTPDEDRLVTLPIGELPTYLRLLAGMTAVVEHPNDWNRVNGARSDTSAYAYFANTKMLARAANDQSLPKDYDYPAIEVSEASASMPSGWVIENPNRMRVDRAVIWAGPSWQTKHTLLDFDVQTSNDGSAWTTQYTLTKPTPTSFKHGTTSTNMGCERETFWDEQWIFDCPFPTVVDCKFVRLWVRAASYGGEPDAASVAAGGQGDSVPQPYVLEIALMCDDNQEGDVAVIS